MNRIVGIIILMALCAYGYAAPDEKPAAKPVSELNLGRILKSKFSTFQDADKHLTIDEKSGYKAIGITDTRKKQIVFICPWVAKHPASEKLRMEQISLWNKDNQKFRVVYDSASKIFMFQWAVSLQQAMTPDEVVEQMEKFFLAVSDFYKQFHEAGLLE